ncbi:MAG: hypothetical protein QX203_18605 [Methylococcaceae bacterium]
MPDQIKRAVRQKLDTGAKQRIEWFIGQLIEADNPRSRIKRFKERDMPGYGVIELEIIG